MAKKVIPQAAAMSAHAWQPQPHAILVALDIAGHRANGGAFGQLANPLTKGRCGSANARIGCSGAGRHPMSARQAFEPTRPALPACQLELSLRTCLTIAGTTPMAAIAGRQIGGSSVLVKFLSRKPQSDVDGNPS